MGARRAGGASSQHAGGDETVKVLVIDDESLIRDIYAEFLALLGHEADLVVDMHEGLARFDPLVHDLVITDFLMRGLTASSLRRRYGRGVTRRRS